MLDTPARLMSARPISRTYAREKSRLDKSQFSITPAPAVCPVGSKLLLAIGDGLQMLVIDAELAHLMRSLIAALGRQLRPTNGQLACTSSTSSR
jgi:hypothetical protein